MSLFGEIVEPVSRALYVDESSSEDEDNSCDSPTKKGSIDWVDETPAAIETLLIFHGQLGADFLLNILKSTQAKSAAHLQNKLLSRISAKSCQETNLDVYKLSSGIYGCVCPTVDIANSNKILELMSSIFNLSKQVIVIATVPAPFYKGQDSTLDLPPAFMRALYTSTYPIKSVIAPLLETPNLVSGVPASVLSWCEIFKKPGCLYVCYSDSPHLDSITAQPLISIFSSVFKGIFEANILNFQSEVSKPSSNLYM